MLERTNIETQYKFVNSIHQLSYALSNRYSTLSYAAKKQRINKLRMKIDKLEFFIEKDEVHVNP